MDSKSSNGGDETILEPGQPVFDETGAKIGVIRAITDFGIEVRTLSDVGTLSLEQVPGKDFGEGYLLWRCGKCGELGDIESIPDSCPDCGSPREELYAYLED